MRHIFRASHLTHLSSCAERVEQYPKLELHALEEFLVFFMREQRRDL